VPIPVLLRTGATLYYAKIIFLSSWLQDTSEIEASGGGGKKLLL